MLKRKLFLLNLLLISMLSSCMIMHAEANLRHAKEDGGFDAVIIPGVPYQDSSTINIMHLRVRWAVYLYKEKIARNLIFSGGAVYTPFYEAKIMGAIAIELGVPPEHVFYETKAEHSTENLYYGYIMAKNLGFGRVAIASDPMQTFLLSESNESFKIDMISFLPFTRNFIRENSAKPRIKINAEDAALPLGFEFIALPSRKSSFERVRGTLGRGVRMQLKKHAN